MDPVKNPRDDEFVRRLQEEQSEAEDPLEAGQTYAANLQIDDEPDTSPENT
jgi:hypothetical protein